MTGRVNLAVACVMLGCALSASAQVQRSATAGRNGKAPIGAEMTWLRPGYEAISLLRKTVDSVDWEDVSFDEIVDWLTEESENKVNILPKWNALSVESVDNESLVSLKLRNISVATILSEAMEQLSEDGQVTYQGHGNILRISTVSDFGRKLEVRIYQVLDLLVVPPDMGQSFPSVDLKAASRAGSGGGGGQGIFQGGGSSSSQDLEVEEQEFEERVEELIVLIATTIEPNSWGTIPGITNIGTGQGTIAQYSNRQLVVRNTAEVHEKIAGFFELGG